MYTENEIPSVFLFALCISAWLGILNGELSRVLKLLTIIYIRMLLWGYYSHCCGTIGTPSPSLPFDSCEILEEPNIQGHAPLEITFSVPMLHNGTPMRDFIAVNHPIESTRAIHVHFLPVNVACPMSTQIRRCPTRSMLLMQ
jgi:hypothetical protein